MSNYGLTTQQTVGIPLLVFAITSPHRTWDQTFLANYVAINIEDELARIPGIGQVKIFGAVELRDAGVGRARHAGQAATDRDRHRERDLGAERRESRGHDRR